MKRWIFWVGIAISIVFLYWTLKGLDPASLWEETKSAQYLWLIPGVLVYFIGVWIRAWRWHYMLRLLKPVPTPRMFPIVCIGYMGNNIFPARAGELLRAFVLWEKEKIPVSASLATIIVERIFDGVVMLSFVFLNLPELAKLTQNSGVVGAINIRQVAFWGTVIFLGALAVFMLAAMFPVFTNKVAHKVIGKVIPARWRTPVLQFTEKFLNALEFLRSPREALMIFATSFVIWLMETGKYWFVMHAFSFRVSTFALMLMNGIVNLATTIPSAPGYIGTFDTPGIELLKAYQVPAEVAASYTFVLHAALLIPITLLGFYYFTREGLRLSTAQEKLSEIQSSQS